MYSNTTRRASAIVLKRRPSTASRLSVLQNLSFIALSQSFNVTASAHDFCRPLLA